MAGNRKNQAAAVHFSTVLKVVLLCTLIGGSAIGYVWQKNQIIDLGRKIKERENRLTQLRDANQKLTRQLLTLRSPPYLERRVKELKLDLVQPAQSQILRLVETPAGEPPAGKDLLLAGKSAGPAAASR